MKYRSLVSLAAVLAFNCGAFSAPASDDGDDVSLINKPAKESFGQRMAHARAEKKSNGPKATKARKPRAAKSPKIPRAPKVPTDGF